MGNPHRVVHIVHSGARRPFLWTSSISDAPEFCTFLAIVRACRTVCSAAAGQARAISVLATGTRACPLTARLRGFAVDFRTCARPCPLSQRHGQGGVPSGPQASPRACHLVRSVCGFGAGVRALRPWAALLPCLRALGAGRVRPRRWQALPGHTPGQHEARRPPKLLPHRPFAESDASGFTRTRRRGLLWAVGRCHPRGRVGGHRTACCERTCAR